MSQSEHATWHTLYLEGRGDAAVDRSLADALREVPGLIHAETDARERAVEILVEHELAIGDAKWVLDDRGYDLR